MTGAHRARFYGWRRRRVTVACRCGWVLERCGSRGVARRAHDWHVWQRETDPARPFWHAVDVEARRC